MLIVGHEIVGKRGWTIPDECWINLRSKLEAIADEPSN